MPFPEIRSDLSPPSKSNAVLEREALFQAASNLVNPASGLANDYLNHFNDILLLIENLPILLPEMIDELLLWRPVSYCVYFAASPLPNGAVAIRIYESLEPSFLQLFEMRVAHLHSLALTAIETIRARRHAAEGDLRPEHIEAFCQRMAVAFRAALARTADLINHGKGLASETPQSIADRLMSAASTAAPGGMSHG